MKYLLKSMGQIQCAKVPSVCLEIRIFFNILTCGAIVPQSLHLPRQTDISTIQSIVPLTKKRDDIRRQTSNH